MSVRGFTRAGHFPTLIAAWLYFDVSVGARWSLRWGVHAVGQAGVHSYRCAFFGADEERAA